MKTAGFIAVSAAALLIGLGAVVAQQAKPMENKGMAADVLSSYTLGTQGLDDYKARQFRMRKITIAAGGVVMYHSHKDRPALTYILSGSLLEHRDGAADRTYNAGDVITEPTSVNHWVENKGSVPAVLVSVDLFKE